MIYDTIMLVLTILEHILIAITYIYNTKFTKHMNPATIHNGNTNMITDFIRNN